jgi:hypothetical protein
MTDVVFYPNLGNDIITPILCAPNVYKIYAFGPIPKGYNLTRNIQRITKIANIGTTGVFDDDDSDSDEEEIEDLLDLPLWCSKSVHFKTKNLYYMQFKYGYEDENRRTITLYYYYKASITDAKWPIPDHEKMDCIIYKDYKLSEDNKDIFEKMKITKPTTKIFSTEYKLLSEWDATEEEISEQEFVDVFDVTNKTLLKMYSTPYRFKKNETNADAQNKVDLSTKPFFRKKAKKTQKKKKK